MKSLLAISLIASIATTSQADYLLWCHWYDLETRLGEGNMPDGDGVFAAMVEVEDSNGNYALDACTPYGCDPEFDGPVITHKSGASLVSTHAASVGRRFLGRESGMAPNLKQIQAYEVNAWLGAGCLKVGQSGQMPYISGAVKVWNHSWVADAGSGALNNEATRRLDWIAAQHTTDPVICVGLNNGTVSSPLLSSAFNIITVGRRDGDHAWGTVPPPADGPGRMRPDIVGPQFTTSLAVATISASSAMLVDVARGDESLPADAEASEVIKAVLMAGADHTGPIDGTGDQWSNESPQTGHARGQTQHPLDPVVGAGHLDIERAYLILTGGQQSGATDDQTPGDASSAGWSLESIAGGATMQWRFRSLGYTDEFTILATWHRMIESDFSGGSLANFDISLLRMSDGVPANMNGDEGVGVFDAGNVISESFVDNVEHIYVTGLQPGHYVLSLNRRDADATPVDVAIAWWTDGAVMNADIDNSGEVNIGDLLAMFELWGTCGEGCDADLTGNGELDLDDLLALIERWGA
jgi:hypothetical protein